MSLDQINLSALADLAAAPAAALDEPAPGMSPEDAQILLWESDDLPGVEAEKSLQNIAYSLRRLDSQTGEALELVPPALDRIAAALERIAAAAERALG